MDKRIRQIIDRWYITEPALLMVLLSHELLEASSLSCPFRCGKGKIEYNPQILETLNDEQLEQYLKAETIRIILKHPYERQPDGCKRSSMSIGSNLVLADNYDFQNIGLPKPSAYNLPEHESYEWYSMRIEEKKLSEAQDDSEKYISDEGNDGQKFEEWENGSELALQNDNQENSDQLVSDLEVLDIEHGQNVKEEDFYVLTLADGSTMRIAKTNSSSFASPPEQKEPEVSKTIDPPKNNRIFSSNETKEDLSSLWEEDSFIVCSIDSIIDDIESSGTGWGSLAGEMEQMIIASTRAKIDYRKTLLGFRSSILSSKRHLTRMRPNRRSGFDNMGSIRRFDTNLLIAVDVSGSITDEVLKHFYSVIERIFKYGIEKVDVVQFDCNLSDVVSLKKAKKRIDLQGRGGTSFQPLFDYAAEHPEYDGLIIFTDGYAPEPHRPRGMKTGVVWVCQNEADYNKHKTWMKRTGRCCFIKL